VNIGSGCAIALKDIIFQIAQKLGRQDLVQLGAIPAPANEPPLLVADVNRLQTEVRWSPKYDLSEGLDNTIVWWQKELANSTAKIILNY